MKFLIGAVIVIGLGLGIWQFADYYSGFKDKQPPPAAAPRVEATQLPGLPPTLESALSSAQQRGALGLRNFLKTYGRSIRDPRLASIELDYAVLVAQSDLGEARRVFAKVKQRTPENSLVFSRVKDLEKTYQP